MLALTVRQSVCLQQALGKISAFTGLSSAVTAACPQYSTRSSEAATVVSSDHNSPSVFAPGLAPIDAFNVAQQKSITIDGKQLSGDPGTSRYTAPFYIPEKARAGMPRVLYSDPWRISEDISVRREQAQMCLAYLRSASGPMTAAQVYEGINKSFPSRPVFGSLKYVTNLLEDLRDQRMLKGIRNRKELEIPPSDPRHPRLYAPLKYQATDKGKPYAVERQKQQEHQERLEHALRRLRRGKAPFPITRRLAKTSIYHTALTEEALQSMEHTLMGQMESAQQAKLE